MIEHIFHLVGALAIVVLTGMAWEFGREAAIDIMVKKGWFGWRGPESINKRPSTDGSEK